MVQLLTIAGFDPSLGAGVTADLQVFGAHGFGGCAAITALTVQSNLGVRRVEPVQAELLAETLACLMDDQPPAGIKIGMLGGAGAAATLVSFLRRLREHATGVPVVLDPVLRSSSGAELLSAEGVAALRDELMDLVDWVTPNRAELAVLLKMRSGTPVGTSYEVESTAVELAGRYAGLNVVVTGGDAERADDLVVLAGGARHWLRGETIESNATHGTGCAFSSALLCGLAAGLDGVSAAGAAKAYVAEAIRRGPPVRAGKGGAALLWPLRGRG